MGKEWARSVFIGSAVPSVPVRRAASIAGASGRRVGSPAVAAFRSCARGRVSAGQFQRAMTHEGLNHARRASCLIGQRRALATQGMEVKDQTDAVPVGDARTRQAGLEQVRASGGQDEHRFPIYNGLPSGCTR